MIFIKLMYALNELVESITIRCKIVDMALGPQRKIVRWWMYTARSTIEMKEKVMSVSSRNHVLT